MLHAPKRGRREEWRGRRVERTQGKGDRDCEESTKKKGGREENRGIGTEERMHREMYVRRKRTWSRYYSSTSFTCVP